MDDLLLSRVEDASLNASAPRQQRWLDGWLVRYSPGKAKRARSINAVAAGRLPLDHKLRLAADVYRDAGLPMVVRITRYTLPGDLDRQLAERGYTLLDDTRVMTCSTLPESAAVPPPPPGVHWAELDAATIAETVGELCGTPPGQRAAQAERLAHAPVCHQAWALRRDADQAVLACGQLAREADLVGLYDIHTHPGARRQGCGRLLCQHLLGLARSEGARTAYLQVESDNPVASRLYASLGFTEAYAYHYRLAP
jgi:ribosomal protein S18 acetylase RimI-like enzyme